MFSVRGLDLPFLLEGEPWQGVGWRLQRLDAAELAGNGAGALARLSDGVLGGGELAPELVPDLAVFLELRLGLAEHAPDFARALLNGQRSEAHLQAVHQRRQGRRTHDGDALACLQI